MRERFGTAFPEGRSGNWGLWWRWMEMVKLWLGGATVATLPFRTGRRKSVLYRATVTNLADSDSPLTATASGRDNCWTHTLDASNKPCIQIQILPQLRALVRADQHSWRPVVTTGSQLLWRPQGREIPTNTGIKFKFHRPKL